MENIIGHKRQIELLKNSISRDRVAHAYIFTGPAGIGKKAMARNFAWKLLSPLSGPPHREEGNSCFHPDLIEISDDSGIKIDAIRKLIYQLALKSYQGKYKIALIYNAESLTLEASSALLKELEEPKPNTVIILVTSSVERLPKTIISRTQKINFGLVSDNELKSMIPSKISEIQKNLIASVAAGRPGLVKKIITDPEYLKKLSQYNTQYEIFHNAETVERLLLAQDLAGLETWEIKLVLDFWSNKLEHQLNQTGEPHLAKKLSKLHQTCKFLDQNLNTKLVLSDLMLNS